MFALIPTHINGHKKTSPLFRGEVFFTILVFL